MAEYSDLYVLLGQECPNFSLPSVNLIAALLAEHDAENRGPIFQDLATDRVARQQRASDVGVYVRWGMVKYRDVARFAKFRGSVCNKVP